MHDSAVVAYSDEPFAIPGYDRSGSPRLRCWQRFPVQLTNGSPLSLCRITVPSAAYRYEAPVAPRLHAHQTVRSPIDTYMRRAAPADRHLLLSPDGVVDRRPRNGRYGPRDSHSDQFTDHRGEARLPRPMRSPSQTVHDGVALAADGSRTVHHSRVRHHRDREEERRRQVHAGAASLAEVKPSLPVHAPSPLPGASSTRTTPPQVPRESRQHPAGAVPHDSADRRFRSHGTSG